MNRALASACSLALGLLAGPASLAAEPAAAATAPVAAPVDASRMNYALGYQLGRDLSGTEFQSEALLEGIGDGRKGAPPKLNPQEMEAALAALEQRINEQRAKEQAAAAQKAAAAGSAFLAENALAAGVKTTASGLQYRIVKEGAGASPTAGDTVTVHYRGTLVDGTEFDSSRKRGQPATFPVSGVIAGWTEALQMMKPGAQWQLVIPPQLAYGDRGPLAGQVLLFDVELLGVTPGTPAAK
jgi:FKBP-type peptidyl-prolyl cis-trans isomerase FklB